MLRRSITYTGHSHARRVGSASLRSRTRLVIADQPQQQQQHKQQHKSRIDSTPLDPMHPTSTPLGVPGHWSSLQGQVPESRCQRRRSARSFVSDRSRCCRQVKPCRGPRLFAEKLPMFNLTKFGRDTNGVKSNAVILGKG